MRPLVWLFDLDNTLHDASHASYGGINEGMSAYIERTLGVTRHEADALRQGYWRRYGATLLGLVRHHGVRGEHFLHHAHVLPGLEQRVRSNRHDDTMLRRLARAPHRCARLCVLTNAPAAYARRVLGALGLARHFDEVIAIEQMRMFGHWRPKPDARMLRALAARLRVHPSRCVLVEDTLEHLKSARRVGMQTVWTRRWLRQRAAVERSGPPPAHRPAYVDHRVGRLSALRL